MKKSKTTSQLDTSIEARFEGHEISEAGTAQIPNLLLQHYVHLGLKDGHFCLLSHIMSRKWTREAPYPTLTHIPMSTEITTRRTYVRDMRNMGLLFTKRLYWTTQDAAKYVYANPGKLRANQWFLGSLLHNLVRIHTWLESGRSLNDFKTIEIPRLTVEMYASGEFNDVPHHIATILDDHISKFSSNEPVTLVYKICTVDLLLSKNLLVENLVVEKLLLEKLIVMNKNHDSKNHEDEDEEIKDNSGGSDNSGGLGLQSRGTESTEPKLTTNLDRGKEVTTPNSDLEQIGTSSAKTAAIHALYMGNVNISESPIIWEEINSDSYQCLPLSWWSEAIKIACANSVRRWSYIQAILDRSIEAGQSPEVVGPPQRNGGSRPNGHGKSSAPKPSPLPPTPAALIPPPAPAKLTKIQQVEQEWKDMLMRQMTRQTYNNLFRDASLSKPNGKYQIAAKSEEAKDWIEGRMMKTIKAALSTVVQKQVEIVVVVEGGSA